MPVLQRNKYYLKSLYEEIDLFDRKLAHLEKFEHFDTDAARRTASDKMALKRQQLVQAAKVLMEEGIEFSMDDLPRSLREDKAEAKAAKKDAAPVKIEEEHEAEPMIVDMPSRSHHQPSPFAGTSLDCISELEAYKRNKIKGVPAA